MERVTQKNERGYYLLGDGIYSDWGVPEKFRGDDVDRLAAYEDTGLEPKDVTDLMAAHGTAIGELAEYRKLGPITRLREEAEAALKKRTPCDLCAYSPPSSLDGKPCTLCPATEKEDNND